MIIKIEIPFPSDFELSRFRANVERILSAFGIQWQTVTWTIVRGENGKSTTD